MQFLTFFFSPRNLEVLILGKGQVGETFFQELTGCHKLRNLIVNDATLGNGIQEIPIYHDQLQNLQIVKCRVLRISVRCQNVFQKLCPSFFELPFNLL